MSGLRFRGERLFYPLFCALHHMKIGLPRLQAPRRVPKVGDYPKLKTVLEEANVLIGRILAAERAHKAGGITAEESKFFEAYDTHWVHAPNRTIMTQYLCRQFVRTLQA